MDAGKYAVSVRQLVRFRDGLSFLYVEHAVVEQRGSAVAVFSEQGRCDVPAAALACLMLGPGTRVTHAAVSTLARCGCSINWVGEDGLRMYANGLGKTRSSRNLEAQVRCWADENRREAVVRQLYELRFGDRLAPTLTLQQIRGREGARVRDTYAEWSRKSGVPWKGRNYRRDQWEASDPINRALSAANAVLYGVCQAGIQACGFSPALGFIHVGKQLSFVYDLADVYKGETSLPAAFEAVREGDVNCEARARTNFRERASSVRLLERIVVDLAHLFGTGEEVEATPDSLVEQQIWDPGGNVAGGANHADHGA